MDADLMTLNEIKTTSVLTCKVPGTLKANFILAANEKGLNVNQFLCQLVNDAINKTHEVEFKKVTEERDSLLNKIIGLEKQLTQVQTQVISLSATIDQLNQDQKITMWNLEAKQNEARNLKQNFDYSQSQLDKAQQETEKMKGSVTSLSKERNMLLANQETLKEKLKQKDKQLASLLDRNKEVLVKLKEREKKADWDIRQWVWDIVNEFPTDLDQVTQPA